MPDCGGCDVHYSSCYGAYGSCGCICTGGGVGGRSGGSYGLECRKNIHKFQNRASVWVDIFVHSLPVGCDCADVDNGGSGSEVGNTFCLLPLNDLFMQIEQIYRNYREPES